MLILIPGFNVPKLSQLKKVSKFPFFYFYIYNYSCPLIHAALLRMKSISSTARLIIPFCFPAYSTLNTGFKKVAVCLAAPLPLVSAIPVLPTQANLLEWLSIN